MLFAAGIKIGNYSSVGVGVGGRLSELWEAPRSSDALQSWTQTVLPHY